MHFIYYTLFIFIFCCSRLIPLYSDPLPIDKVQHLIDRSTITRIQKPLTVRTDKETLEYFMEHVEELTKQGKDFKRNELILEIKEDGQYGIRMPSKRVVGEFQLVKRQPQKVIYMGHGNATTFFSFSGSIVLEVHYTTQKDEIGPYENIKTTVHLKFDNAFLAILAKAATPILIPKLDKLITKFSMKTKSIIETAYANKKN